MVNTVAPTAKRASQASQASDLVSYFTDIQYHHLEDRDASVSSLSADSPFASTASDTVPSSSHSMHPDDFSELGEDICIPPAVAVDKVVLSLGSRTHMMAPMCPRTPSRIDPNNPPWPAYRGYHEFSFAHATMGVRLPTILGKAIEDVVKTLNSEWEVERIEDLVGCVRRMEELMVNLSGNQ